jgi:pyruvate/2-oxoglutarate dehydrogenase complex dihydrolipoamide dehydrogenase (E3) component
VEFAQAFRRLDSRVTIIQRQPRLLPREDPDVSEAVLAILRGEGIDVLLATEVSGVEGRSGDSLRLALRSPGGDGAAEGTDLLVATGRTPNTEGLGLDVAGVAIDGRGYIRVNERLETTAPGIWAMGDVAGSPQYTHVALDDYRVVKANLSGGSRTTAGRLIPSCTFIDPELGRVGLNESEARGLGLPFKVARLAVSAVPRARTLGETHGFMKAVIEPDTDRILGFTMLGAEAGEVVAAVQVAMLSRLTYTALRDGIFAHPTMAEGLNLLFSAPMR